jgi:hypothetical protein
MMSPAPAEATSKKYIYDVEKILDKRIIDDKVYYLLKWVDYSDSYNTWEPEEHLDCQDLVDKYEDEQKASSDQRKQKTYDTSDESSSFSLDVGTSKKHKKKKIRKHKTYKSNTLDKTDYSTIKSQADDEDDAKVKVTGKNGGKNYKNMKRKRIINDISDESSSFSCDIHISSFSNHSSTFLSDTSKDRKKDSGNDAIVEDTGSNSASKIDSGKVPEKIIGANNASGQLMYLIKWKGIQIADLVPAEEFEQKYKKLVLEFFLTKEPLLKTNYVKKM